MRYFYGFLLFFSLSSFAQTVSIALKDAPTKAVLAYLAQESGKNMVLEEEIKQHSTLRLEKSSIEQIIKSISHINQLSLKTEKGIYYITIPQQQSDPPLLTQKIPLTYAKASEVIQSITKGNGNLLSHNGYLHFDERSNSIIIKDTPHSLKQLAMLIKQLDAPTEQIAIEARIVTISSEHLKELGVRWGMFNRGQNSHRVAGNLVGNDLKTDNLNVNFPVLNAPASAVLQIASINSRVLDLELSALERENSVEIIARPRLLTTNKQSASIKQGTEIPYAIYNKKSDSLNFEFKEAVLGLEVTPQIAEKQHILLDLTVTQNSPNDQNGVNGLTTIDKQELKTQVFAKSGETIVLGGVFQHLVSKGEDRVPVLGSIPVLKYLFSQSRDKISKRELVIFVTPHIIQTPPIEAQTTKGKQKVKQK